MKGKILFGLMIFGWIFSIVGAIINYGVHPLDDTLWLSGMFIMIFFGVMFGYVNKNSSNLNKENKR